MKLCKRVTVYVKGVYLLLVELILLILPLSAHTLKVTLIFKFTVAIYLTSNMDTIFFCIGNESH